MKYEITYEEAEQEFIEELIKDQITKIGQNEIDEVRKTFREGFGITFAKTEKMFLEDWIKEQGKTLTGEEIKEAKRTIKENCDVIREEALRNYRDDWFRTTFQWPTEEEQEEAREWFEENYGVNYSISYEEAEWIFIESWREQNGGESGKRETEKMKRWFKKAYEKDYQEEEKVIIEAWKRKRAMERVDIEGARKWFDEKIGDEYPKRINGVPLPDGIRSITKQGPWYIITTERGYQDRAPLGKLDEAIEFLQTEGRILLWSDEEKIRGEESVQKEKKESKIKDALIGAGGSLLFWILGGLVHAMILGVPVIMIGLGLPRIVLYILIAAAVAVPFIPITRKWLPLIATIIWGVSIPFAFMQPFTWFTAVYIICGGLFLLFEILPRLLSKPE